MKYQMRRKFVILIFLVFLAGIFPANPVNAQTTNDQPVVRAVLFFRSTCPHCQKVVAEVLPPLYQEFGSQMQILHCDVSAPDGETLFTSAIQKFNIQLVGVPTLIVGEKVLVGSDEIANLFPLIVEDGLSQGGIDWPPIPGLDQILAVLAAATPTPETPPSEYGPQAAVPIATAVPVDLPQPSQAVPESPVETVPAQVSLLQQVRITFNRDPAGNTLSVFVLLGLVVLFLVAVYWFLKKSPFTSSNLPHWSIPVLSVIGFGIAVYLAYLEITLSSAICGPVGHCETVQQSSYAWLFGSLPIGLLGAIGYIAILTSWTIGRFARRSLAIRANLILLLMAAGGTLFSIYLTFLEPFVIGATCLWCLSSSVLMVVLLLLVIAPGRQAVIELAPRFPFTRSKSNRKRRR